MIIVFFDSLQKIGIGWLILEDIHCILILLQGLIKLLAFIINLTFDVEALNFDKIKLLLDLNYGKFVPRIFFAFLVKVLLE
jgi:hypothetical protein